MRSCVALMGMSVVLCWGCNRGGESAPLAEEPAKTAVATAPAVPAEAAKEPSPAATESSPAAPVPIVVAKPIVANPQESPALGDKTQPAALPAAEEKKAPVVEMEKPLLPPLFKSNEAGVAKPDEIKKDESPQPAAAPAAMEATTPPAESAKPELSVVVSDKGTPELAVKFSWKEFARPSLQLTLGSDPKPEPMKINDAEITEVFGKLVGKLNKPTHPGATTLLNRAVWFSEHDGGKPLRIFGATNALGRASAYAVDDQNNLALAFYLLDCWSDPEGTLHIALSDLSPVPKYAEAGQLQVWFLNDQKVIWNQSIAWPGTTKSQVAPAATPSKPGDVKPATPEQKAGADQQKPAATEQKTSTEQPKPAGSFDPFWKPPAKSAAPGPTEVIAPPALSTPPALTTPPLTPPAAEAKPAAPAAKPIEVKPAKTDLREMNIEEAAQYIDKTWAKSMSPNVAKTWRGGMANYFQVDNPEAVRLDVFMTLVKNCWTEQQPGELRNALAILYQKLKQRIEKR